MSDTELVALHDGRVLTVHADGGCLGVHCCIHDPSQHPLRDAPLSWVPELPAMFRVCEHGVHHPDPDDLAFKMMTGRFVLVEAISSVHLVKENCDGCCYGEPPEQQRDAEPDDPEG